MPGTITNPRTWPTVDNTLSNSPGRGMCFKNPSDGNIYIAIFNNTFLALNKATGTVIFATIANNTQYKVAWDPTGNQFYGSPAGGGFANTVSRYTGAGVLIDNPASGLNCYGQVIVPASGLYFAGDLGDDNATVLTTATGAPFATAVTPYFGVTAGVGAAINPLFGLGAVWMTAHPALLLEFDAFLGSYVTAFDLTLQSIGRIGGMCDGQTGNLWISDALGFKLAQLDLFGNVLATFPVFTAGTPGPLAFDGTYFWLLDFGGGLSVYDSGGTFLALTSIAGSAQDVACDAADGPGFCWVTSSGGTNVVQQFQYHPPPGGSAGGITGTFTGFWGAGKVGGGTK